MLNILNNITIYLHTCNSNLSLQLSLQLWWICHWRLSLATSPSNGCILVIASVSGWTYEFDKKKSFSWSFFSPGEEFSGCGSSCAPKAVTHYSYWKMLFNLVWKYVLNIFQILLTYSKNTSEDFAVRKISRTPEVFTNSRLNKAEVTLSYQDSHELRPTCWNTCTRGLWHVQYICVNLFVWWMTSIRVYEGTISHVFKEFAVYNWIPGLSLFFAFSDQYCNCKDT